MRLRFYLLGAVGVNNPAAIKKSVIEAWQKSGVVRYLGVTKTALRALERISCVVLPSYREGLSRTLLEALGVAKPIIASDVTGCAQAVEFLAAESVESLGAESVESLGAESVELLAPESLGGSRAKQKNVLGETSDSKESNNFTETSDSIESNNRIESNDSKKSNNCDESSSLETPSAPLEQSITIGKNGILCRPKDAHSLYLAMKHFILMSKEQKRAMGAAGREFARRKFDVKFTIEHYLKETQKLPKNSKIALFSNSAFSMFNFRREVIEALILRGFKVHIIAPTDDASKQLSDMGCVCHNIALNSKGMNPVADFALFWRVRRLLKAIAPSMLFCYTIKPVIYGCAAAKGLKIPHVAMITGLGFVFIDSAGIRGAFKAVLRNLVCAMYKTALKKAQKVWFLNDEDRDEFVKRGLVGQKIAQKIDGEGVNLEHFKPVETEPVPTDEIRFLLMARMLWDKGVGEYVEAIKLLRKDAEVLGVAEFVDMSGDALEIGGGGAIVVRFYLLGAASVDNPAAISKRTLLSWGAFVKYLGQTRDVRSALDKSTCIVLPSFYKEGLPRSLLESMSMKKPIITTTIPGCADCVEM